MKFLEVSIIFIRISIFRIKAFMLAVRLLIKKEQYTNGNT